MKSKNIEDIRWSLLYLLCNQCTLEIPRVREDYFNGDSLKVFKIVKELFLSGKKFNWKIVTTLADLEVNLTNDDIKTEYLDNYIDILKSNFLRTYTEQQLGQINFKLTDIEKIREILYNTLDKISSNDVELSNNNVNIDKLVQTIVSGKILSGIHFGIKDIDETLGGITPGEFFVIAARPSLGKSALCCQLAINNSYSDNKPSLFFSLEDSEDSLLKRFISHLTGINFNKIWRNDVDSQDKELIYPIIPKLKQAPIHIIDNTSDLFEIVATSRKMKTQLPDLNLIIVDYVQLVHSSQDSEYREISVASRVLKNLAKELKVSLICVSQLNRLVEQRENKHPVNSDLRGSGTLEQDADRVMFIYRPYIYNRDEALKNVIEYLLTKNRHGELINVTGEVHMSCFQFS